MTPASGVLQRPQRDRAVSTIEAVLRPLVDNFEKLPIENGRKIRELLNGNQAAFLSAATGVFLANPASRGSRHLVTVLADQDLLFPLLLNPMLPLDTCLAMARIAVAIDRQFYLWLSSLLQKGILETENMPVEAASRILAILNATMEPHTLAPLLRKILVHPNARVRSKATLLIGRGQSGIDAIEALLLDDDSRVRANAVEALWSNPDPRVIPIFTRALDDSNNRVIGNALLGLYRAGSMVAVSAAFAMAQHQSAVFRGTACWMMGESGDPRFIPHLAKTVGTAPRELRRTAFAALQSAKKSDAARTESLIIELVGSELDDNGVHFRLKLTDSSGHSVQGLTATSFLISAGADQFLHFVHELEDTGDPQTLHVLHLPSAMEMNASRANLSVKVHSRSGRGKCPLSFPSAQPN